VGFTSRSGRIAGPDAQERHGLVRRHPDRR
jgi:hypothetical protein